MANSSGPIHYHLGPDGKSLIPDNGGPTVTLNPNDPLLQGTTGAQDQQAAIDAGKKASSQKQGGFWGLFGSAVGNPAAGAQSAVVSWTQGLGQLLSDILSPIFWEHVAFILGGLFLVIVGVKVWLHESA